MFYAKNYFWVWAMLFVLLPFSRAAAADNMVSKVNKEPTEYRINLEYLYPSGGDRNINTVNLDIYRSIIQLKKINLSIHGGLSVTWAEGEITQLEGDINQGTLHEVNYDNRAAGIGPSLLADLRLIGRGGLTCHLEGSGGVLLYSKKFPAGGDQYNFMWRGGPVVKYDMGNNRTIGIGYQWMHVSNGQGLGDQNPTYNAEGVRLIYSFVF